MDNYNAVTKAVQGSNISINWGGALLSYACVYALLVWFSFPCIESAGIQKTLTAKLMLALRYGGLLGILAYGVYNFTNVAVLTDYSWSIAVRDTLWGGTLMTLICLGTQMV